MAYSNQLLKAIQHRGDYLEALDGDDLLNLVYDALDAIAELTATLAEEQRVADKMANTLVAVKQDHTAMHLDAVWVEVWNALEDHAVLRDGQTLPGLLNALDSDTHRKYALEGYRVGDNERIALATMNSNLRSDLLVARQALDAQRHDSIAP